MSHKTVSKLDPNKTNKVHCNFALIVSPTHHIDLLIKLFLNYASFNQTLYFFSKTGSCLHSSNCLGTLAHCCTLLHLMNDMHTYSLGYRVGTLLREGRSFQPFVARTKSIMQFSFICASVSIATEVPAQVSSTCNTVILATEVPAQGSSTCNTVLLSTEAPSKYLLYLRLCRRSVACTSACLKYLYCFGIYTKE